MKRETLFLHGKKKEKKGNGVLDIYIFKIEFRSRLGGYVGEL